MAFGTGQHPTTLMCLRALEETVQPGAHVLDLGAGSGVLALATARLGAASVLALDTDPQAVQAAHQNVRLNGLEGVVHVEEGTLDRSTTLRAGSPTGPFDVIVANISPSAIVDLAGAMASALQPGGMLIAGGFSEARAADVAAALSAAGLAVERTLSDGDWRTHVEELRVIRSPPSGSEVQYHPGSASSSPQCVNFDPDLYIIAEQVAAAEHDPLLYR
jgi:ribosomal protein L11 methyltransferase